MNVKTSLNKQKRGRRKNHVNGSYLEQVHFKLVFFSFCQQRSGQTVLVVWQCGFGFALKKISPTTDPKGQERQVPLYLIITTLPLSVHTKAAQASHTTIMLVQTVQFGQLVGPLPACCSYSHANALCSSHHKAKQWQSTIDRMDTVYNCSEAFVSTPADDIFHSR